MPLAFNSGNEQNERIDNILKRLIGLEYVPDFENDSLDKELADLGLSKKSLSELSASDMVLHIQEQNFDWKNAELFADFLMSLNQFPEEKMKLKMKAVAIYNYIQSESKIFSFDIFNKIAAAKI